MNDLDGSRMNTTVCPVAANSALGICPPERDQVVNEVDLPMYGACDSDRATLQRGLHAAQQRLARDRETHHEAEAACVHELEELNEEHKCADEEKLNAWATTMLPMLSPAPNSTKEGATHDEAMQVDSMEEEREVKLPRSDDRCVSKTDSGPTVEDIRKRKRADVNECMDDPSPCFPLAEYHMTRELARGALNEARERKDPDDPDDEIVALEVAYHEACALYKDARDELCRQLTAKRSKRGSAVLEHVDEMNAITNKDEISRRTDKMTRHALDDDDDDRRTNEAEQVRVALRFHQTGDPALRT